MIFITGATGNVGTPLLNLLSSRGHAVRALSRQASPKPMPHVEWVQGSLAHIEALQPALQGVSTLVLISPAGPAMQAQECAAVDAARACGVRRVVKLSGLGAGPEAPIRLPKAHYAVERHIVASGLAHTFVRPNLFCQTLLGSAGEVSQDATLHAAAGDARISFTDVRDIAEVIAEAATGAGHDGRAYEITGPQAWSYAQVTELLSRLTGREVRHVDITPMQQRASLVEMGVDAWTVDAFVELFGIYRAGHGSALLAEPIERLTGHPARGVEAFLREHAERFSRLPVVV